VEDFVNIDRINRDGKGQLPATCWNCKTHKMTWHKEFAGKPGPFVDGKKVSSHWLTAAVRAFFFARHA
jgi:hypothetical protein